MTTSKVARRVSEMSEAERRFSLAYHELCEDGDPHDLEEHEPFDIEEGDEPWDVFVDRLARHGLRLELI